MVHSPDRTGGQAVVRMERRWFAEFSVLTFGLYLIAIAVLLAFLFLLLISRVPVLFIYIDVALLILFALLLLRFLVSIRPATFELCQDRVRLLHGRRLHREIVFGPEVHVGIVRVGYWDDLTAGPGLKHLNADPSLHDYKGFGPLFGYSFEKSGVTIVVSRKRYWNLREIQAMWAPLMDAIGRHQMRMDPSMHWYLRRRMELGLPPDGRGPSFPVPGPERIFYPNDR